MSLHSKGVAAAAIAVLAAASTSAQEPGRAGGSAASSRPASEFVVLGTASGPVSEAMRAQPANALIVGDAVYLVDAGDGAVAQLARAGLQLPMVSAVFLSHLHFDHTAGMLAVIGLRMQLETRAALRIYGPAGTREFIEGLLAASGPAMRAGYGIPDQRWQANVDVVEIADGDSMAIDAFQLTIAENTHFKMPDGSADLPPASSLSFRFDLPDRSIVYTGDTGPSETLIELARGTDLLVSEMIDVDSVLAFMRPPGASSADAQSPTGFAWHMYTHHMTPTQVGELAHAAQAKRLVITHYAPNPRNPEQAQRYLESIAEHFAGPAELARDLGRY